MKIKSTIRIMVCLLILLSIAFPVLAQMDNTIYNLDLKGHEYVESEAFIMSKNITKEKLELLKRACEEAEKKDSLSEYSMYNDDEAKFYENSINNLIREIEAYNFTEDQIEKYIDGLILSTPNTIVQHQNINPSLDYHYRPFPDNGTGYEVQSLTGYNQSTAYGVVGDAKTIKVQGQAAYMFYTVGGYINNKYISNDYGIGYYNGSWRAIASGPVTGWDPQPLNISITKGQRIYMNVNLIGDYVRIRVLDGNNFNNVICDYSFYDKGYFPDSGSGIHFNRQITLCDTDKVVGTGLYFKNASFSDSYIYNNSGYSRFSSNNTNSARRGAFEADWTTRNNNKSVTVHSYNQWYEEKISIEF